MASVKEHYNNFLAEHYSWMFGDYDSKVKENKDFFERNSIKPRSGGRALDLGCGTGFQTVALAELGFKVLGIDLCETLLKELRNHLGNHRVELVQGDILDYKIFAQKGPFEVVVCMGDTVTHLQRIEDVGGLLEHLYVHLEHGGTLALNFRDLTPELKGLDRIIPVKSDNDKIMATFLEYAQRHVHVHDMIFIKRESEWELKKSVFKKLRISTEQVETFLKQTGFKIRSSQEKKGFATIIAHK